jgi:hypothetical protein
MNAAIQPADLGFFSVLVGFGRSHIALQPQASARVRAFVDFVALSQSRATGATAG